jgi:hypothetical protein
MVSRKQITENENENNQRWIHQTRLSLFAAMPNRALIGSNFLS